MASPRPALALACLLAACGSSSPAGDTAADAAPVPGADAGALPAIDTLAGVYGHGGPGAAVVSADGSRAFAGAGTGVLVLDLSAPAVPLPATAVLGRIEIDAPIAALALDGDDLFVAGGSIGLFHVDLRAATPAAARVDDGGDRVCLDVAAGGGRVFAVFAARDASELRIYDRASLAPLAAVALPDGIAFALDLDPAGDHVYLAMGPGGFARVRVAAGEAPALEPGPRLPDFLGEPGWVRDVAVAGGTVFAAGDAAGLAWLDAADWSPGATVATRALAAGGKPSYAHRVAAADDVIAVGANSAPAPVADGAPFDPTGVWRYDLAVGPFPGDAYPAGADALFLLDRAAAAAAPLAVIEGSHRWRSLQLGQDRVYIASLADGFAVRARAGQLLARHQAPGIAATDGRFSLRDPELFLVGTDGDLHQGMLDLSVPGEIAIAAGSDGVDTGLWWEAQWLDAAPAREWFVAATTDDWRLFRWDTGAAGPPAVWPLPSPVGPDGKGRNYYLSQVEGDLLLLTRGGTRYGLVGYSRAEVQAAAEASPPGTPLAVEPRFQLPTHFAGAGAPHGLDERTLGSQSWRVFVHQRGDGRRVALIAAGTVNDPGHALHSHAQLVLYDVSAGAEAEPALLAVAHGSRAEAHAVAVQVRELDGRALAFVADVGGGVWVVDVTDPEAPFEAAEWRAPADAFDGLAAGVVDLETEVDAAAGAVDLYLAALRRGVVRLRARLDGAGALVIEEAGTIDTPGLAEGVTLQRLPDGSRRLAVADGMWGVRLYVTE